MFAALYIWVTESSISLTTNKIHIYHVIISLRFQDKLLWESYFKISHMATCYVNIAAMVVFSRMYFQLYEGIPDLSKHDLENR